MTNQLQKSQDETVVKSSTEPNYSAVAIPAKPATEYTYVERRAELLQLVEQAGHPAVLNQSELADRYGVSQQQISKDFDRLDEFIRDRISTRRDLSIKPVYERCVRGLLNDDEFYQAAQVARWYDDYLAERINTLDFRARLDHVEELAEDRHARGGQ